VPNLCGPYSNCTIVKNHVVCLCQHGYIGTPPNCKPNCLISSECAPNKACINQRCTDPCSNLCAPNSQCKVINHKAICTCKPGFTGDPIKRCLKIKSKHQILRFCYLNNSLLLLTPMLVLLVNYLECSTDKTNPCDKNPCGFNSVCRSYDNQPVCSCRAGYIGLPPNCRLECTFNTDCNETNICAKNRCTNPCPGRCAPQALCSVINHKTLCICPDGYTGNPYQLCSLQCKALFYKLVVTYV